MKEDLGFYGNELSQLQTMYIIGAALGQIPFLFVFTYVPMYWLVPGMDICWGIATLLQFRAQSFAEMAAYRFLVGWFEVCFFFEFGEMGWEADGGWAGCVFSGGALYAW